MSFWTKKGGYAAWSKLHKGSTSRYVSEIRRKHSLHPDLPLKALRRLGLRDVPTSLKPWRFLTGDEKILRDRALHVRWRLSETGDFAEAIKGIAISPEDVIEHLGKAILKRGVRWLVRKHNNIEREWPFYEHGQLTTVVLRSQRDAHRVAQYLNATKEIFKKDGDLSRIKKFEGKHIIDADGERHYFETDPQAIYDIVERMEEPEVTPQRYHT